MVTTADQIKHAFLDALAWGESEPPSLPHGYGYNILVGSTLTHPHTFPSYDTFPKWSGWVAPNGSISHAAGRYQFQPATWLTVQHKLNLRDFSPVNQDSAAWDLAQTVYWHMTGGRNLSADLLAGNTGHVALALHSTWTSLNTATFDNRFHTCLAKVGHA